jgi:hypothetical protein
MTPHINGETQSGLFSATVAALLTVSIPDLKPNPQDTSAFYLRNLYQLSANPNASYPSIPSALAEPPAFSPPRYAIWVNSLWFLSLAVSLSGATVAMLFRNWAVQYISVTQPPCDTSDKQARIRAIFAKGNPGPNTNWGATEGPVFLQLSILLFITGGIIYLFNINRSVFYAVVWWVGYMAILYVYRSVAPIIEPHSLFHTPLSSLALHIYLLISYAAFQICSHIPFLHAPHNNARERYRDLRKRYGEVFLVGKRREANEIASEPSSEIDALILERILLTLDEDRALETFFDTLPGFCNSKLSALPLSLPVQRKLRQAMHGFLDRTFSSSLISELVRTGRLITCLNAAHAALGPSTVLGILNNILNGQWDGALQSVEIGHALRLWGHSRDHDPHIQRIVACIIVRARRRDDRWTTLVKEAFGVQDSVLRGCLAHGDSALLSRFDIHNTLPGLQRDFCTLWNEIVQEARVQGSFSTPAKILHEIRHIHTAIHQGADVAPPVFSSSTDTLSYSLCEVASHRPDSTTHAPVATHCTVPLPTQRGDSPNFPPDQPTLGGSTAPRQTEGITITAGLPTTSEFGENSRASPATLPAHSSSSSSNRSSRDGTATAQPDIILSHSLESNKQGTRSASV